MPDVRCPRCNGALVASPSKDGYYCGYYCDECGWDLPPVSDYGPDYVPVVQRVWGLFGRVRIKEADHHQIPPFAEMPKCEWDSIVSGSAPVRLGHQNSRDLWWFDGRLWTTNELNLSPDVFRMAAVAFDDWVKQREELRRQTELEDERIRLAEEQAKAERRQAKLAWADAKLSGEASETSRRQPIPRDVRREVFRRDGGRCVECGSDFDLQYDHVIPISMGGANSVQNLQLLCGDCNRRKGGTLG